MRVGVLDEASDRLGLDVKQKAIRKKEVMVELRRATWNEIERRLELIEDEKPVEDDE